MQYLELFYFVTHVFLVSVLGWYLITNLQWYNYKIERVILKHHKTHWHFIYFLVPSFAYYFTGEYFWIFFYFAIVPAFIMWCRKLDKPLVLTWRVKRFLALLLFLTLFQDLLCAITKSCAGYGVFMPLIIATVGSTLVEKYLFTVYKKQAFKKLQSLTQLKIIAITGSYGKTSIKNFLHQLLSKKHKAYMTPRSVNTIGGIVKDINVDLDTSANFYVVEAGAREMHDIKEITQLVHPHFSIVSKIGPQHLEYFKHVDNIKKAKLELINSPRLERAFVHESADLTQKEKVHIFGSECSNINVSLDGTSFDFSYEGKTYQFNTPILGSFQALNLAVCLKVCINLGFSIEELQKYVSELEPVEHRLQRIDAGGKIIIDDGFNGNIDGMLEGINLCHTYDGRKVIVTPGLIEATDELNLKLIERINEVFDIVIVTGTLNSDIFDKNLAVKQKVILKDKTHLEKTLAQFTKTGDIILFANDAPNFI